MTEGMRISAEANNLVQYKNLYGFEPAARINKKKKQKRVQLDLCVHVDAHQLTLPVYVQELAICALVRVDAQRHGPDNNACPLLHSNLPGTVGDSYSTIVDS